MGISGVGVVVIFVGVITVGLMTGTCVASGGEVTCFSWWCCLPQGRGDVGVASGILMGKVVAGEWTGAVVTGGWTGAVAAGVWYMYGIATGIGRA